MPRGRVTPTGGFYHTVNRMKVVGNAGVRITASDALHLRRLTKRSATHLVKETFCKQPRDILASEIEYLEEWEPRLAVCERSWGRLRSCRSSPPTHWTTAPKWRPRAARCRHPEQRQRKFNRRCHRHRRPPSLCRLIRRPTPVPRSVLPRSAGGPPRRSFLLLFLSSKLVNGEVLRSTAITYRSKSLVRTITSSEVVCSK